tara:strand:+ start:3659 stop:4135 length:477 start_codon:yes stop_codon:yes gene_type:complete
MVLLALAWYSIKLSRVIGRVQSDILNLAGHITESSTLLNQTRVIGVQPDQPDIEIRSVLDFSNVLKDSGAENISLNMDSSVGNNKTQTVFLDAEFYIQIDQLHELFLALQSSDPIVRVRRFRIETVDLHDDAIGMPYPARHVFLLAEIIPLQTSNGEK